MARKTDASRGAPLRHLADRVRTTSVLIAIRLLLFVATHASLPWITNATRLAGTLETTVVFAAHGIVTARVLRTAVLLYRLALLACVTEEPGRARTLRLSIDDPALGIQPAGTRYQARIDAFALRALLVQLAIIIRLTLVLHAAYRRITLVTVGAEAQRAVVRHLAQRILSTRLPIGARIGTLAIEAGSFGRAVHVRATAGNAGTVLAQQAGRAVTRVALRSALSALAGLSTSAILLLPACLHAVHTVLVASALSVALLDRRATG